MADHTLDAKGMNCPLPILKARKALKEVPSGGTLEILATDPGLLRTSRHFVGRLATSSSNILKTIRFTVS